MDTKIRVHRAPKTLITGNGCVAQIGVEAKKLNATKVLILTDPGVAMLRHRRQHREAAARRRPRGRRLRQGRARAADQQRHEIVDITKKGGYDLIVGFGGGSAIDVAKMVAALAANDDKLEDFVGIDMVPRKGLPLIAVPTTAGTGARSPRSRSSPTRS